MVMLRINALIRTGTQYIFSSRYYVNTFNLILNLPCSSSVLMILRLMRIFDIVVNISFFLSVNFSFSGLTLVLDVQMPTFLELWWNKREREGLEGVLFVYPLLIYSKSQGTLYLFQEQVYIGESTNLVHCSVS